MRGIFVGCSDSDFSNHLKHLCEHFRIFLCNFRRQFSSKMADRKDETFQELELDTEVEDTEVADATANLETLRQMCNELPEELAQPQMRLELEGQRYR